VSTHPIRVLIVDDDLFVRGHLRDYLTSADGFEVVGSCCDGAAALSAMSDQAVDVVLMDIRMPIMDGVEATRLVTQQHPATRVLALTSFGDDDSITRMFESGACGFLLKNTRPQGLIEAVRAAHQGLSVIPPDLLQRWANVRRRSDSPALTGREVEVLGLLAQGLNNRQIGEEIYLSASTVKGVLRSLMRKFETGSRVGVLSRAHELGLMSAPGQQEVS
jgi:DNA-binding NarL/FixJ family response regulator